MGIKLHSLWTPRLDQVHGLAVVGVLNPSAVQTSELGERSFVVGGPDGATWQVIQREQSAWESVTRFQLVDVNN